ncbi:MAG TPA: hypothetical protein VGK61_04015 [Planctomycetota bacterium]|jgi:hypothetical protein
MHDSLAPEVRDTIRRDMEGQGYSIERQAVRGLWVRRKEKPLKLSEGMVYRDHEPIMAIMKSRRCFLVITASHGGMEGNPYLFSFNEAHES